MKSLQESLFTLDTIHARSEVKKNTDSTIIIAAFMKILSMRPWGQIFLACNLKCVFFSLNRVYVEATYFSQFYHCPQICLLFAICYLIIPRCF